MNHMTNRIAVVLGLMSFGFAALFAADLRGFFNRTQKPVATLKAGTGTVRRLAKGELTWDRAPEGTLFGAGDTLATGDESLARLAFLAGGDLELDAGGMVVLGDDLKELQLNFVTGGGRVRVPKSAKPVVAVTKTGKKAPAVEVAQVEDDKEPPTPIAPPKPKVVTQAIQEKAIRNPLKTLAVKDGLVTVEELPPVPELRSPANDAVVDMSKGNAKLEWLLPVKPAPAPQAGQSAAAIPKAPPQKFAYEITLKPADGKSPPKILRSEKEILALNEVQPGRYLWNVRAVNPAGKRGPASNARWLEVKIPIQISQPKVLPVLVE